MPLQGFGGDIAAALLSSSAYTAAFYPIHRIKVLIQTQDGIPDVTSGRVPRFQFTTSFRRIIREEGFMSLWRGCMPYMLRHVPSTTLSFAFKDAIQRALPNFDPITQPKQYMLSCLAAGGGAGALALAVVYPLDLTTIRMAAHLGPKDPGMIETMEKSRKRGGIRALYRGYWVSACAIGGYKALYFGLYDIAKTYLISKDSRTGRVAESSRDTAEMQHQQSASNKSFVVGTSTANIAPVVDGQRLMSKIEGDTVVDSGSQQQHYNDIDLAVTAQIATIPEASPLSTIATAATGTTGIAAGQSIAADTSTSIPDSQLHIHRLSNSIDHAQLVQPPKAVSQLVTSWLVASAVVYVASTITYPLDVVRKRWVLDSGLPPENRQFHSAWHCLRSIATKEGVKGLYRFYGYDMVLRFGGGILLVMYDEVRTGLTTIAAREQTS